MNSILNEDASMSVLSHLNDSDLMKIYISGTIPFLSSVLKKNQFWHMRVETISELRVSYSSEVNWRQTYYILRRELATPSPRFWNKSDNVTVPRILLAKNYQPRPYCLSDSIIHNCMKIFKFLLSECEVELNATEDIYYTPPLILAIEHYRVEMVKILLSDSRVDIHTESENRHSALSTACIISHNERSEEILRILLADPRIDPTYNNSECISLASEDMANYCTVMILLYDGRANPREALISAAQHHCPTIVSILLEDERVDPALRNNEALFSAVDEGDQDSIRTLLADRRVNPNDRDGDILAASVKHYNSCTDIILRDKRTDPTVGNNKLLRTAILLQNIDVIDTLLQREEVIALLDESYLTLALKTEDEDVIETISKALR